MKTALSFKCAILLGSAACACWPVLLVAQADKPSITSASIQQDHPLQMTVTVKNVKPQDVRGFMLFTSSGKLQLDAQKVLRLDAADVTSTFIQCTEPDPATFGKTVVYVVDLKQTLQQTSYVLVAVLASGDSPTVTIGPSITVEKRGDATGRYEIILKSAMPLGLTDGKKITLSRSEQVAGASAPRSEAYIGTVTAVAPDSVSVRLDHKLPAGQKSTLSITDPALGPIGTVDLAGVPQNESDAFILVKTNAVAAVHQAPVFTLSGSVAPWHPGVKAVWLGSTRFDPSVVFDVGLRSTKSQNSITVPAPFSITEYYRFTAEEPSTDPKSIQDLHSSRPVGFTFTFGPRYETDRTFQRVNLLGELRGDFYFPGLLHGATAVKARTLTSSPQLKSLLIGPTHGYEFVPYIELDGGGHVRTETVTNTKTKGTEMVPQYPIGRFNVGMTAKVDFTAWFHVSLDASLVDFFQEEQIGYTTRSDVAIRKLRGIHPHFKPDFTVNLDKARHWAIDVTWENGRSAPNFEYLNTVNSGIKVIY